MAYEPTNWKSGDVVTSSKLNKMEQGIAGGGAQFVDALYDEAQGTITIQETAGALFDYCKNGPVFIVNKTDGDITGIEILASTGYVPEGGYTFITLQGNFTALTSEDYPASGGK